MRETARSGEPDRACAYRLAHLALHRGEIVAAGRLAERTLAHHIASQRGMADVSRVVDPFGQPIDRVQILWKVLPRPADPRLHRFRRDVLGALQVAHHQVLFALAAWRQGEAAVAHHDRRHPMPARTDAQGISEDLRVHVGVSVDESGRDDGALRVDRFARRLGDFAHGHDFAARDSHVGAKTRRARAVDNKRVADDKV